jgi:predicted RNA-binding Zn-ribbon protein involved in translation (DUF1610 family)
MGAFKAVRVSCSECGWTGRRKEPEALWWRSREVATCPKCGHHAVNYHRQAAKEQT